MSKGAKIGLWLFGIAVLGLLVTIIVAEVRTPRVATGPDAPVSAEELRDKGVNVADAAAKSLIRNAMMVIESAYVNGRSFDITPAVLNEKGPPIDFHRTPGHLITSGEQVVGETSARALDMAVDYYGDVDTYSVATLSDSGAVYGVCADKSADGGTLFVVSRDGVVTEGWSLMGGTENSVWVVPRDW